MSPRQAPSNPPVSSLKTSRGWLTFMGYAWFILASFSIAGTNLVFPIMLGLVWYRRRHSPQGQSPQIHTHQGPGLPRWVWFPFVGFVLAVALSALAWNPGPAHVAGEVLPLYRLSVPFLMLAVLEVVDLRRLLRVFAGLVMVLALYSVAQYFWGWDLLRPEGSKLVTPLKDRFHAKGNFSHHLTFAGAMLLTVPLYASLALSEARENSRRALFWGLTAAAGALCVLLSLGRSGWLGMALGVAVLGLKLPRRWVLSLFVPGLVGLLTLMFLLQSGHLREMFTTTNPQTGKVQWTTDSMLVRRFLKTGTASDSERLHLWRAALLAAAERPLLGHGGDPEAFGEYRRRVTAATGFQYQGKPQAHNIYLQMIFYYGILGLGAYLSFWAVVFYWAAGSLALAGGGFVFEKALLWGASGALAGSMTAGFFENNFLDSEVQVLITTWMGLILYAGRRIRQQGAPDDMSGPGEG
ncbi:MAG: O-antigen ligase family protein [Deltaproteobacteria bacterium]|nr:O-antigen ligase family protein [Deltaproteobacteria bacterium]